MSQTLIKGRILSFKNKPINASDSSSYEYISNGALLIEDGSIIWKGNVEDFEPTPILTEIIDHQEKIIMAGFIDTHCHYSQGQAIASYGEQLLDWLSNYTFVEEEKFSSRAHSKRHAKLFFDEMLNCGTTTVAAYCTVHTESVDAFFEEASRRNMRVIGGQVLMDRNAPQSLCVDAKTLYDQSGSLINKWHRRKRCHYAVTPRFAITSSYEGLAVAGALLQENKTCYLQTHLSENEQEIEDALGLFPDAQDYLDIYDEHGLLGEFSLFGHCIHLTPREVDRMVETQSRAIFCPTSNLFLGSGVLDFTGLSQSGVQIGIATDIGAGTTYSMLETLGVAYGLGQLKSQKLNPLLAFYMATLGNARVLSLEDMIGTLEVGTEADIIVLDPQATPTMKTRLETIDSLEEELFILQIMGDDRAVSQVYLAGKAIS